MNKSNTDTLSITCICITRNRVAMLKRAIACFEAQTYPNKELLIVYEDDDLETAKMVTALTNLSIKNLVVSATPKHTLGSLRNLAIKKSTGDIICQWDDDDWYHMNRLEMQMSHLIRSHKPACILEQWIIFNESNGYAYMGGRRLWEGSIMCYKSIFKADIVYADTQKGEDTVLITKLISQNMIYPLLMPQLYIYVFHENNTWGPENRDFHCSHAQRLSPQVSAQTKAILDGTISIIDASHFLDSSEMLTELKYI